MKKLNLYLAEILKPASRVKTNYKFLLADPKKSRKPQARLFDSIDDIIFHVLGLRDSIKLNFPQDKGIYFNMNEGRILSYFPLEDKYIKEYENKIRVYKE